MNDVSISPGARLNEKIKYQRFAEIYSLFFYLENKQFQEIRLEDSGEDFTLIFKHKRIRFCQAKDKKEIDLKELRDIIQQFNVLIKKSRNVECALFSANNFNTSGAERIRYIFTKIYAKEHPNLFGELKRLLGLSLRYNFIRKISIEIKNSIDLRNFAIMELHRKIGVAISPQDIHAEFNSLVGEFLLLASTMQSYSVKKLKQKIRDLTLKYKCLNEAREKIGAQYDPKIESEKISRKLDKIESYLRQRYQKPPKGDRSIQGVKI